MADSNPADWPIHLFNKSVLKQRKLKEILAILGPTEELTCLDIGGDNGVISYLLRQQSGYWKSADIDSQTVKAIQDLVTTEVYQLDETITPFNDSEFDKIVIVDYLEHIKDDSAFITELHRILRTGGTLIINVPHTKHGLLRKLRLAIGQTDEKHGHVRSGYSLKDLDRLTEGYFIRETHKTYSKFFSELIDTILVFVLSKLQKGKQERSRKGMIVTGKDMKAYQNMFRAYSMIYPVFWFFSKLDSLLFFTSGYMLIARVRKNEMERFPGDNYQAE